MQIPRSYDVKNYDSSLHCLGHAAVRGGMWLGVASLITVLTTALEA